MTEIEGYTDLEVIGRGGFAVVYKARQVSVGRDVAIKLLIDPSPDDDQVRRFERESKAVGALSWHPHIAAVVDAGATAQGQAYIVFEFLAGGSLEERLIPTPLPWTDAVASMIQIADAVEAAHRADVLHRDIKPANILKDRLGVAKLGDFGIASMQDGNKTETGMLATTVAHAAPELFDGQPASTATDVYALGSTLHNLVTGTPPFATVSGERMGAVISRIINQAPPRPPADVLPDQISNVIAHALGKQPAYRPRSAAAFGQALQQAQRELGVAVTAMPVSDSEPIAPHSLSLQVPSGDALAAQPPEPPTSISRPAPQAAAQVSGRVTSGGDIAERVSAQKPLARTIGVLGAIAAILAIGFVVVLVQSQRDPTPVATTQGGAEIRSYDALALTEMAPPFNAGKALDQDETTYWGIQPGEDATTIRGTSFVIKLAGKQDVVSVGMSNGESTQFGRVSEMRWATTINALESGNAAVVQRIPDAPGEHRAEYRVTTDQIVVFISGVHNDQATNAGIAELLIEIK